MDGLETFLTETSSSFFLCLTCLAGLVIVHHLAITLDNCSSPITDESQVNTSAIYPLGLDLRGRAQRRATMAILQRTSPGVVALAALSWLVSPSAAADNTAADYFVHSLPGAPESPFIKMHAG